MALSPSPTCSSLQSSIFQQTIKLLYPTLLTPCSLKPNYKRRLLTIRGAAAVLESSSAAAADNNGAVGVVPPKNASFGRQYFPLAAVVGQVPLILSLSLCLSLSLSLCVCLSAKWGYGLILYYHDCSAFSMFMQ